MPAEAICMLRDELTAPALEHDEMIVRRLVASHAAILVSDAGVDRALVVLWRGATIVGALQGDDLLTDLDGLPVAQLGAALRGGASADIARLIGALVESRAVAHEIIRDAAGASIGVVAVGAAGGLASVRTGRALGCAAAALAAWSRASADGDTAGLALIERIAQAIIVHDHDVVLAVNRAAVHMLGCDRADAIVGAPLTMVFPRLPRLPFFAAELGMVRRDRSVVRVSTRSHGLLLAGRAVRAMIVEEAEAPVMGMPGIDPMPAVHEAVTALAPVLRRAGRTVVGADPSLLVAVEHAALREVLELALLEAASTLDEVAAADNRLDIAVQESPDGDVVIEVTASGTLVTTRCAAEPIGWAACGVRVGELGGDLEIATTLRDRRALRLVLPHGGA